MLLGDVERGVTVNPAANKIRWEEAAADILNDYRINGKRSAEHVQRRLNLHLTPHFRGRRLANITSADWRAYVAQRQAHGIIVKPATETEPAVTRPVSNAELNREAAIVKRMFRLATQAGKLTQMPPYIPMLAENNARQGFFEDEQFRSVLKHLPEHLRPVIEFAYITGWRVISEVLTLTWAPVRLDERLYPQQEVAGVVRLETGSTKNGRGREFPCTEELRDVLARQHEAMKALQRRGIICPSVFQRNGNRIRDFRGAWETACRLAGCPGRIPHDFRRTAVRNLVRAGVPEKTAMQLTGHKTRSVFDRYDIISGRDLADAVARLSAAASARIAAGQ
jgi:integrase